jgi:tetratricopeptide (TPR) repeat protein
MIKFFRKIRHNMLTENKFSKYLLYAIGEVVLLIVGILFALQINNWNSNKIAHHQELELYAKLLNDLNENFKSTIYNKTLMKRHQNVHYQVYNESKGRAMYSPIMNYSFLRWIAGFSADISEKHTESLSRIKNDSIRDLLKDFIRKEKKVSRAFKDWNKIKDEGLKPFFNKYGIYNTQAAFTENSYDFEPLLYIDLIDHSKLKEQYGSTELDQILFELRLGTSYAYSKLKELERSNNEFEEVLVNALTQNGRTESIIRIPRKHLSDLLTNGKTIDDVIQVIKGANENNSDYITSEEAINAFGYILFRQNNFNDALKLFKINTELYPVIPNTWDSYSECLLAMGKKEEGIKAFKKFVELSPDNESAKRALEELERTE